MVHIYNSLENLDFVNKNIISQGQGRCYLVGSKTAMFAGDNREDSKMLPLILVGFTWDPDRNLFWNVPHHFGFLTESSSLGWVIIGSFMEEFTMKQYSYAEKNSSTLILNPTFVYLKKNI